MSLKAILSLLLIVRIPAIIVKYSKIENILCSDFKMSYIVSTVPEDEDRVDTFAMITIFYKFDSLKLLFGSVEFSEMYYYKSYIDGDYKVTKYSPLREDENKQQVNLKKFGSKWMKVYKCLEEKNLLDNKIKSDYLSYTRKDKLVRFITKGD